MKTTRERAAEAVFGKLASDSLARQLYSLAVRWPKDTKSLTDRLGSYAGLGTYNIKRGKRVVRTVKPYIISPPVDALLDILIPALCERNPKPFQLLADAIEAQNAAMTPASKELHAMHHVAHDLAGATPPFNEFGDGALHDDDPPAVSALPVSESEFKRLVADYLLKRWGRIDQTNPGTFHRRCVMLGYSFAKDPKCGGRPKKGTHTH